MFWRKKALHEEIISQFANKASVIFSEDSQKKLEQLNEMVGIFEVYTSMRDQRKGDSYSRKTLDLIPKCMLASYYLGYFKTEAEESFTDNNNQTNSKRLTNILINICFPLVDSFDQIIEYSYVSGGLRFGPDKKIQNKQNVITEIYACATKFFNDGVSQRKQKAERFL